MTPLKYKNEVMTLIKTKSNAFFKEIVKKLNEKKFDNLPTLKKFIAIQIGSKGEINE